MAEHVYFDGRARVDYHQLLVESGEQQADFDAAFAGETNGLVGAAVPGCLVLITGTHTGDIGLRVVLHDDEPAVDPRWEDVVEATFIPVGPTAWVRGLMSDEVCTLPLPAAGYRVRWSGLGMDEAYDGAVGPDEALIDSFELALWPAAPAAEEILRRTSRRGREAHLAANPEGHAQLYRPEWGDDAAGDVQRHAARAAVELDRAFAERLGAASRAQLVAVRNRLVRFACVECGSARLPWVASALDDLDAGRRLPATFDPGTVYARLDRELDPLHLRGAERAGGSLFMLIRAADQQDDPVDGAPSAPARPTAVPLVLGGPLEGALEALVNAMVLFDPRRDADVIAQALAALDG